MAHSGVVFPEVDGRRSTSALGRAVVADALRGVDPVGARAAERETSWRQGYLVGIANPKVALFFLAFFPQFLDPARGSMTGQILVLGTVFVLIGLVLDSSYGALAGTIAARLGRRRRASGKGRVAVGLTYIGLGGFTAATGSRAL